MILVLGTIRLPADRLGAALPAMTRMMTASRAEAGCLEYGYSADLLDSGLIHVTEQWEDRAALAAHMKTPHIAEWRATWPTLGIGERNLTLYEVASSQPI